MTGWGTGLIDDAHEYEYELVRTNKKTREKHAISFTQGILGRMQIAESEWKPVKK